MFCPNCGNNNLDGTKYCTSCGSAMPVKAYETQVNEEYNQTVQPNTEAVEDTNPYEQPQQTYQQYNQAENQYQNQYQTQYQTQYQQPYQQPYQQQYQQYQQPYQQAYQPQYNTQPNASKMSRDEFFNANPELKSKLSKATTIQTLIAIGSVLIYVVIFLIMFLDYNNSYYAKHDLFEQWLDNNIETWTYVIICAIVSDIIASVSLNSYAKSLRGQAEMAYTNYMFPTQNSYYANQAYATTWICPNCNSVCQMHSAYCTKCGTVKR